MKKLFYLIIILFGCSTQSDQSDAYGNFESEEIFVSAETNGKLTELSVREGEKVTQGQVLAVLDTMQFYLQKGQLESTMAGLYSRLQDVPVQLASLREQENVLEREQKRVRSLLEDGAATSKQLDDITGEITVLRKKRIALESQLSTANQSILSEIEPLKWKVKQLEDMIMRCVIKAPANGTILEKYRSQGEVTAPGQPLFKLAGLDELTLRVYVSGSQLPGIKLNDQVIVKVDGIDGELVELPGTIQWISDRSEFTPKTIQTRSERVNLVYAMEVRTRNDGKLKIGMPGEVVFDVN